jgi:protein gp37
MHPDWARSVRDQCQAAGVPFFFKRWGELQPFSTADGIQEPPFGAYSVKPEIVGKRTFYRNFIRGEAGRSGRLLDGREWNEFPATGADKC